MRHLSSGFVGAITDGYCDLMRLEGYTLGHYNWRSLKGKSVIL